MKQGLTVSRRRLVCAAALASLALSAPAAVIVYDASVGPQGLDWTSDVSLPHFDASLGTLQSVQLRLAGYLDGQLGVENLGDKFDLVYATLAGTFSVYDDASQILFSLYLARTGSVLLAPFDFALDYAGDSGYTFSDLPTSRLMSTTYTSPGNDIGYFIGTGSALFRIASEDASSATAGAGTPAFFSALSGTAELQVIYTYAPPGLAGSGAGGGPSSAVPEPGNLLGWGMVTLFVLGYRRLRYGPDRPIPMALARLFEPSGDWLMPSPEAIVPPRRRRRRRRHGPSIFGSSGRH